MKSKDDNGEATETFYPLHDCTEQDFDEFFPLQEKYIETYETLTANGTAFQCLDWSNPELALRSKDLQDIEFLFIACYELLSFQGMDYFMREGLNPEALAFLEKECGAVPEGEDKNFYHYMKYYEFVEGGRSAIEAAMYFSEEVFVPDNYNENSFIRESKLAFQKSEYGEN